MTLIDTHAHLYDDAFDLDRADVLTAARQAGVTECWLPNCDVATAPALLALTDSDPNFFRPMMGLHPTYVNQDVAEQLAWLEAELDRRSDYIAVGEIGLDFYWDMTFADQQRDALRQQLGWAAQRGLFVSLHTRSGHDRDAFNETADIIKELALPGLRGIFHCFTGTLADAERAIALGFKLGIGGVATFKNGGLDKVLPYIGLEHLVLETDAPYLAPVPHRGKRNESAYVPLVARRVAELMNVAVEDTAAQTTANAKAMYEL